MRIRRALLSVIVATVGITGMTVAPAAADPGGGPFECTGFLPVWPTSGSMTGGACDGIARGVYREGGTTLICAPFCDFHLEIFAYSTTCVPPFPPPVTFMNGEITISNATGTFQANVDSIIIVGADATITTSSPTGGGKAVFVVSPPIPTCAAPAPINFLMSGTLVFV